MCQDVWKIWTCVKQFTSLIVKFKIKNLTCIKSHPIFWVIHYSLFLFLEGVIHYDPCYFDKTTIIKPYEWTHLSLNINNNNAFYFFLFFGGGSFLLFTNLLLQIIFNINGQLINKANLNSLLVRSSYWNKSWVEITFI